MMQVLVNQSRQQGISRDADVKKIGLLAAQVCIERLWQSVGHIDEDRIEARLVHNFLSQD